MSALIEKQDFEEALKENLSLYTSVPEAAGKDLFQTHREIAIARYALSKQAASYAKAIDVLFNMLALCEEAAKKAIDNEQRSKVITSVMVAINAIEQKSTSLISSSKQVTELLGYAVNIDVDKANLRALLCNLPSLVKDSITSIAKDPELAERISNNLNTRISDLMVAIRFSEESFIQQSQPNGIIIDQYNNMMNSVPTASFTPSN